MKLAAALSLATLALASPLAKLADFEGMGKIIVYKLVTSTPVGCLTNAGLWTVDNSQCGTFTGNKTSASVYAISSTAGTCGTDLTFSCGTGLNTAYNIIPYPVGNRLFNGDLYSGYQNPDGLAPSGSNAIPITLWRDDSIPIVQLGWQAA